ncbi:MAG: 3-deoxy-D-manno-octulosonic acid transferase [Desulfobacteraceae bacterium]|nr:3-deoxy-D-manno-octulosonic acid transferase [Desulfobacteraceae bacterium]
MKTSAFIPNFFKIYNILWQTALPFLKKNKQLGPSFKKRTTTDHLKKADIWIQAASAGEAFLALSLLSSLKPTQKIKILITATTSQGIEILESGTTQKKVHPNIDCYLEYFPFDIPQTIYGAVSRVNPKVMILLETEIWPALLYYLKKNHTQIFIINARLSKKSARHYKWTKFLWSKLSPDNILAISPPDAKKYARVFDKAQITTMPNIKFDLMISDSGDNSLVAAMEKIIPRNIPLSILASIRRQEETQGMEIIKHLLAGYPHQIIAVFPRHMHRIDAWKKRLEQNGLPFRLRSKLSSPIATAGIILWDTFGELRSAYGIACTVFVGGSLQPLGGQNFIEPTVLGTPTVTGPHLDDFTWVGEDIFNQKIVTRCKDSQCVAQTMIRHLKTPIERFKLKQRAQDYIQKKQGGTRMACQMILERLKHNRPLE